MTVQYQVYLLTFTTILGTLRQYVGMTKVRTGETPSVALRRRRHWHVAKPVAWLKTAVEDSMRMMSIGGPSSKDDALADEAIEAAIRISDAPRHCRGGPWCLPGSYSVLPDEHSNQVKSVIAATKDATTQAAKRRALRALKGKALTSHLAGARFTDDVPHIVQSRSGWGKAQNSGHQNRKTYESSRLAQLRYVKTPKGKLSQKRRNDNRKKKK